MAIRGGPGDTSRAFAAAINAGDVDAAVACWTRDGTIVAADGTRVSGEMLRARFEQLIAGNVALAVDVSDEIEIDAVATARTRMTVTGPDAQPPVEVHATVVYLWAQEGWRLAIDRIDRVG